MAESQVVEANVGERCKSGGELGNISKENQRFGHRHAEHVGDACTSPVRSGVPYLQSFAAVARTVAIAAAQVDVRQELHFDVFEAAACAGGAATGTGIETESTGGVAAFARFSEFREPLAHHVEGADVARRIRARGTADRRLIDEYDVSEVFGTAQPGVGARRFRRSTEMFEQSGMQDILHERGLARARDSGDAHQPIEREADIDAPQVVLRRAEQFEEPGWRDVRRTRVRGLLACGVQRGTCRGQHHLALALQIGAGDRLRFSADFGGCSPGDDFAAVFASPRTHVEQTVGLLHDLRVVLDDQQGIASIAQPVHHTDHPLHVAGMQADRRLIEHEQGVDQRGAERRGQIDALHLAAGKRA